MKTKKGGELSGRSLKSIYPRGYVSHSQKEGSLWRDREGRVWKFVRYMGLSCWLMESEGVEKRQSPVFLTRVEEAAE